MTKPTANPDSCAATCSSLLLQVRALEKKLSDARYLISQVMEEVQYEHGFNSPAYRKCAEAATDGTRWTI
jgi:hypothetical protein